MGSVSMKLVCVAAFAALAGCGAMKDKLPGGASGTGSGIGKPEMPAGTTCNDDRGVEQAGKEMDTKAYDGMVSAHSALAHLYDAAGRKPEAEKTRADLKAWQSDKSKAPSGSARIEAVRTASDKITKGAEYIQSQNKTDDATRNGLKNARMELRKALVYIAWGAKIGEPVPGNAKAAIEASKACATKVKPAADAAAGLSTLLTNIKKSYGAVDAAAKKAGNPELTEAEKRQQESETGAPSGLGV